MPDYIYRENVPSARRPDETINPDNGEKSVRGDGRRYDVVSMRAVDGKLVSPLPWTLTTIVEEAAHVGRF